MKKKRLILISGIVCGIIALLIATLFTFGQVLGAKGYGISVGRLYFKDGETYLIENENMAMRVYDLSDNAELFKGYDSGDKVILLHGAVDDSYPAVTDGYRIFRLSKGDKAYNPPNDLFGIAISDAAEQLNSAKNIDFGVQYIRTGLKNQDFDFPSVAVIRSEKELAEYYEANKDNFYLERYSNTGASFTVSYPDACMKYNSEYFKKNALVYVVLKEGSSSVSHKVESVKADNDGMLYISIRSNNPETGDCDMAYWHIMTEIPKDKAPESAETVDVYYDNVKINRHTHTPAKEEQTVKEPFVGYCGNTQTTIYFDDGKSYTFMSGNSVIVTDILRNLQYDKNKLCKCMSEYTVDTEYGLGYGVNLTEGYARCDKGQADLTTEQIEKLREVISWAKDKVNYQNKLNFEFSLTWNTYGVSSYDSKSGVLIKTTDASNPEAYKTTLKLDEKQYSAIWKLIKGLNIEAYPDNYNPHGNGMSTPYMTLILSVKADGIDKTVTAKETMISYIADNKKGQKFLDVCKGIEDIITSTEEWKSLPEYERLYD